MNDIGCEVPVNSRNDKHLFPFFASTASAVPSGQDLFCIEKESFLEICYFIICLYFFFFFSYCLGANKTVYRVLP